MPLCTSRPFRLDATGMLSPCRAERGVVNGFSVDRVVEKQDGGTEHLRACQGMTRSCILVEKDRLGIRVDASTRTVRDGEGAADGIADDRRRRGQASSFKSQSSSLENGAAARRTRIGAVKIRDWRQVGGHVRGCQPHGSKLHAFGSPARPGVMGGENLNVLLLTVDVFGACISAKRSSSVKSGVNFLR
ncbi:hypothetical protein OF83DRAFT_1083967 [Amylostereum chailletii]|nr:hypothetical protein OF83DRAFT_1083967 [Amylostereum chailletii]